MKRILLSFLVFFPLIAFSQIEKGNFLLSGNLMYQSSSSNQSATTNLQVSLTQVEVSPYVGYFVSSRFAIGIYGSYTKNDQKQNQVSQFSIAETVQKSFNIGPFVRYYQPIGEKFYMFAQGDVAFGKGTVTYKLDPSANPSSFENSLKTTTIAIRPGIAYYLTNRLALELILGSISYSKYNYPAGKDEDGFSFKFITRGLSPGLTFTF